MKKKIKFIGIILIVIAGLFTVNTSTSRYLSQINYTRDIAIAVPQIELVNVNSSNDTIVPGNSKTVEFEITNFKGTQINEVLMRYYINLDILNNSIPLNYEIYEINGTRTELLNQTSNGYGPIELNYGEVVNKVFRIVFTWDESDNNVTYADEQFEFKIEISAEQVI